ncbi:MAG TPA: sensor histidine kinase [Jatrophihabitans sp.]|uniref:sensor histidine kinase n=1 Tax=Jatrophihabitans sp. TaxID=1932789 RepID=UPI002DF9523F|nr:sensor histidine kinase [Jatrophihabitans sp.]
MLDPRRWRPERASGPRRRDRIASALAFRLEHAQAPDELLAGVVAILHGELELAFVRLEIGPGVWGDGVAAIGTPVGEPLTLPLTYQGHPSGQLTVSGRRRGRPVPRRDHLVLLEIARNAGPVLHTARLLGDLRQSLDGVLYAREDERRRLRHELHDSLGPILAGISLGLHAARRLMTREPEQADELVSHLEQELQAAIAEVRRLFETLRPPALDQLGLLPAVREHIDLLATRMRSDEDSAEQVSFELHHVGDLAALPAIVEIAAYRIVCEALTNVARHSGAHTCTVNLSRDKGVRVEVVDDGVGYSGRSGRGLGLGSMRERAAELGGTFLIESPPAGGTRVVVTLPVHPVPASR